MVTIKIRITTTGNHAYLAENGTQLSHTTCIKHLDQTGVNVIEDRGASNHSSTHDTTYTKNITVGDTLTVSLWEYVYATNKSVTVYVNDILFGTNSGNSQCITVTGNVDESYLVTSSKPTMPTYLETLDKLDQWSSAQYIPDKGAEGIKPLWIV